MTEEIVWDEAGARYYETGVSKGLLWTPSLLAKEGGVGVPWNGLVAVNLNPQGGETEAYYFDGVKYMNRVLAVDFQAEIQTITTPREFLPCEGERSYAPGVMTSFNKRDKFHMAWRTEIGSDQGEVIGHKIHIAYNNLVQPSVRNYQTIADTTSLDTRTLTITATPACGRNSYFWFDSRYHDLTALEEQLAQGILPMCYDLRGLIDAIDPEDPDYGCAFLLENFEDFIHGQTVDSTIDDVSEGYITESVVEGKINDGLDITILPAEGAFAANDSAASAVGTGDLTDDDDSTYITSADGDLGWTVGLPPLVGYVEDCVFELHVRMSITGGVNPDDPDNLDADAQIHISTDADGDLTIGGFSDGADEGVGFSLDAVDGTIVDYVVPLDMDAWVDTEIEDIVTALEAGAYLNVVGVSNNNPDPADTPIVVNIYEMHVEMLNDTSPGKWLRRPDVDDHAVVANLELTIADPAAPSVPIMASASYYVDFKVFVANVEGSDYVVKQAVMGWNGLGEGEAPFGPGSFYVRLINTETARGLASLYWFNGDGEADVETTAGLNKDIWYRLRVDWSYGGSIRARLYKRDNLKHVVMDHTASTGDLEPVAYMQAHAGLFIESENAAEVGIDNAKIQVHCNDTPPGFTLDVPARWCNQPGTDPAIVATPDDSSEIVIAPGERIGVGYFAVEDEGETVPPRWIYMPPTPDGFVLARATYVVRAYRAEDHGVYTGAPVDGYIPPTNVSEPFLNAETSATSNNYSISVMSVGSFEEFEWEGDEVISRLTNPPGSQAPCTRLWVDWFGPIGDAVAIHVSYYAIRLYYEPA